MHRSDRRERGAFAPSAPPSLRAPRVVGVDETDAESFRRELLQQHPELHCDAEHAVRAVAAAAPDLAAIVPTEVNPTHDPDGQLLRRYVDRVGGAIAAGLTHAR